MTFDAFSIFTKFSYFYEYAHSCEHTNLEVNQKFLNGQVNLNQGLYILSVSAHTHSKS